jgi:hypothetical protein
MSAKRAQRELEKIAAGAPYSIGVVIHFNPPSIVYSAYINRPLSKYPITFYTTVNWETVIKYFKEPV